MTPRKELSKEEKNIAYMKRWKRTQELRAKWTTEQWTEYRKKRNKIQANWRRSLTSIGKEQLHQAILLKRREKWASMTPQEREVEKQRHQNRRKNFTKEQLEHERERGRENIRRLKIEVLNHYSNGQMRCMTPTCEVPGGTKNIYSLCIDHINGGGRKHVEELKKSGIYFYQWLKQQHFPEGFQVLCFNCNNLKKMQNKEDYRTHTSYHRPYRRKIEDAKV